MKNLLIIFGVAGALIIAINVVLVVKNKKAPSVQKACTVETKLCPDGSAVSRTGPKCEFAECTNAWNDKMDLIQVSTPTSGAVVTSPLNITGKARGTWYFEASFPVRVYDANEKLLGTAIAQADGDWMTENFVPFKTTLVFSKPTTATGVIVFEKDNPSGLPEHANSLRIQVRF